jgi:hypothetical protein
LGDELHYRTLIPLAHCKARNSKQRATARAFRTFI